MKFKLRIISILLIFSFLSANIYINNFHIAASTKSREFQNEAWNYIVSKKDIFSEVRDGDFFLSRFQNDAFETNVANFYYHSGIRLSYIFNSSVLLGDIDKCQKPNCHLGDVYTISAKTLANVRRTNFISESSKGASNLDWVDRNLQDPNLSSRTVWAFDMFLMTENIYVVFLVPFTLNKVDPSVDISRIKVAIYNKNNLPFKPSIDGLCLSKTQPTLKIKKDKEFSLWMMSNKIDLKNKILDYRDLRIGTC